MTGPSELSNPSRYTNVRIRWCAYMKRSPRVIGYVRPVSFESQRDGDRQIERLREVARERSWRLRIVSETPGAPTGLKRAGLHRALRLVAKSEAEGLAVSRLDRLTESLSDLADLFEWFGEAGAALVSLEPEFDTSEKAYEAIPLVFEFVAGWEREAKASRTREGLARRKHSGLPDARGAVADDPELVRWIKELRADGLKFWEIADRLNDDGVPTVRGGKEWRSSSLQTILGNTARSRPARSRPDLPPPRAEAARERRPKN